MHIQTVPPPLFGSGEIQGRYQVRRDPYPLNHPKPLPWYYDQTKITLAAVLAIVGLVVLGAIIYLTNPESEVKCRNAR